MNKINLTIIFLALFLLCSCKKFLEEPPKIQAEIKTADQLDALINNATLWALDGHNATMAYSSDDTEIPPDLYKNYPSAISLVGLYHYVFDIQNIAAQSEATYMFWAIEFQKILRANIILANVESVTGSQEQKNRVKADAYFIRAYAYWNLVNYYCQPYAAENLQTPGLPLKTSVNYDESLKRATLQATYDFIQADLTKAYEFAPEGDVADNSRWRITKVAIDAFLSRYYLFTGDYTKSLQHADQALGSATVQLVDFNTIGPGVAVSYTNPTDILRYSALNDWTPAKYLYWKEFYYTRFAYSADQWFIPSQALRSLYDSSNDMRYVLFMIPNGSRKFSVISTPAFRYTIFQDGRYLPTGPTRAEVLLNKAEAAARLNNYTMAISTVNLLRAKRLKVYEGLTASNPAEALSRVLQERRRELPFSFRWWDIRRFSVNADASDDVVVTHTLYKLNGSAFDTNTPQIYILPVKSTRYMVPISEMEINNSQGQIEQNRY